MAKKQSIVITGKAAYIKYLSEHLKKEHPSTRRRLRIVRKTWQ